MTINWTVSKYEDDLISRIAERAAYCGERYGSAYEKRLAYMDITAAHCNGCPLSLHLLLDTKISDFTHDVFGIRRHIDRETGKLGDGFSPRYALCNHVATSVAAAG